MGNKEKPSKPTYQFCLGFGKRLGARHHASLGFCQYAYHAVNQAADMGRKLRI
jgi:hypothetical protein